AASVGAKRRYNTLSTRALRLSDLWDETGERIAEHELHRLRGEFLLVDVATPNATARTAEHLEWAIAIAAERKALLFELRAATRLLRLHGDAARERVARLVERFDAANDCEDARIARAALGVSAYNGPGEGAPGCRGRPAFTPRAPAV